jgi:prolyl-tRNA synthetase
VRDGDRCPRCGSPLVLARAIEVGHIFQLGRKYADAFTLDVLGPSGTPLRVTMGSYGIGISRAVAAIAEQSHDERGLIWPAAVAPAVIQVLPIGKAGQAQVAERIAREMEVAGLQVMLDDRGLSPGVAFNDADLMGVPTLVVVGKALSGGHVEVRDRRSGDARMVPVDEVVAAVAERRG